MKSNILKKTLVILLVMGFLVLTACESSQSVVSSGESAATESAAAKSDAEENNTEEENIEQGEKSVTLALSSAWDNLNPLLVSADYKAYLQSLIFDRLVTLNNDRGLEPRLLESWEFSDDGLTVTGHIFENAYWHDGEPVTAEDVVFTLGLFTNPSAPANIHFNRVTGTNDSGLLEDGQELGVEAIGEKAVVFHLKQTVQETIFFSDLEYLFILPSHLLENEDVTTLMNNPFFENPVGSGPFKFESQTPGTELVLRANEEFHLGAPDFDKLTVRVVPNNNVLAGLLSGEIDLTGGSGLSALPYDDFVLAQQNDNLITASTPALGSQFAILNEQSERLSDVRVRQAIEYAIDKQNLVDNILKGEGRIAYSFISDQNEYYNQELRTNAYDPDKAKELLDEAGFDYSEPLTVLYGSNSAAMEQAAVLIQQDLAAVGIQIEVEPIEFTTLMALLREQKDPFDIALLGRSASQNPSTFRSFYRFGTQGNFARLPDGSIADLFIRAEVAPTVEESRTLYAEAQQKNEDDVPYIYLYRANNLLAYNKRISGLDFGYYFLIDNIWNWKVD